jgi:hypothetical protein
MSSLTTNPTTTAHRAQIVAEAVVSAYINEISPTARRRARARHSRPEPSPRTISRTTLAARAGRRALAPRRRTALELRSLGNAFTKSPSADARHH